MIQARIVVTYSVITEIPRKSHVIVFTSQYEAIKFVRDHSRWFSRTEIDRQIEITETLTLADF